MAFLTKHKDHGTHFFFMNYHILQTIYFIKQKAHFLQNL